MSYQFPALSMGVWLILWNCVLIIAQILILRKKFRLSDLLQIPVSFIFGYFTDFGTWCISSIPLDTYLIRLIMVIIGTIILGFGTALSVIANVAMNPGEAIVRTIASTTNKNFGNIKIVLDVIYVIISVILSLIFFNGAVVGTREGTVIAAIFTGMVVRFFTHLMEKPFANLLGTTNNSDQTSREVVHQN